MENITYQINVGGGDYTTSSDETYATTLWLVIGARSCSVHLAGGSTGSKRLPYVRAGRTFNLAGDTLATIRIPPCQGERIRAWLSEHRDMLRRAGNGDWQAANDLQCTLADDFADAISAE